jgi:O-antigen/teichoic acid export membrane protein
VFKFILLNQSFVSGSRFLIVIMLARFLGLEEFGIYNLLWSVVLFLVSIQIPAIINPMLTMPSENKYFFTVLLRLQIVFLLFAMALMAFIFLIASYFYEIRLSYAVLTILYGCMYMLYEFLRRYELVFGKNNSYIAGFDIFVNLSALLMVMYLGLNDGLSIEVFFLISTVIFFIASFALISRFPYRKNVNNLIAYALTKKIFLYAKPQLSASILQFMSGNFFVYMSAILLGPVAVGAIRAAASILSFFIVIFNALDNYLPKIFREYMKISKVDLYAYFQNILVKGLIVSIPVSAIIIIYSKEIILLAYGEEYVDKAFLVVWFSISHIFMYLIRPVSIYLRIIGEVKIFSSAAITVGLFTLLLTIPFIYLYGYLGAMVIMLGQQILQFSLMYRKVLLTKALN